ncbi:hypothetical protein HDU91_004383, partial [Kappamyces sp. JEL0680]
SETDNSGLVQILGYFDGVPLKLAGDTVVAPRKVLVYEWMSLGQLSHQLAVSSPMTLLERIDIALQVAKSVALLHNQHLYHSRLSVEAIYLHRTDTGGISAKIGNLQHLVSVSLSSLGRAKNDWKIRQNARYQTITAFGWMLYQLSVWKLVDEGALDDVVTQDLESRPELDPRVKTLILACLQTNISARDPTIQTIEHQLQEILQSQP